MSRQSFVHGFVLGWCLAWLVVFGAKVAHGLDIDPRDYDTPQEAATAVRQYISKPNRTVVLKKGVYDFGNPPGTLPSQNWQMQPGTRLICPTRDATFRHNAVWIVSPGCQFELNNGVSIDGVAFDNYSPINAQSVTIGFGLERCNNATAYIRNCTISGNTHTVYTWAGQGNRSVYRNCIINGGRFVAGIGSSGAGACAFMDLIDCEINADGALSRYTGQSEVECRVHGVYFRGGVLTVRGCTINCIGTPDTTYPGPTTDIRGIWAPTTATSATTGGGHEGGNPDGRCYVYDTNIRVTPNGATGDVYDLQSGSGQLKAYNGSGSAPSGKYMTQQTAPGSVQTYP